MEAEDWVAVAFFILLGVFAYLGIHRTVLRALDHRRDRIKNELDDARKLKDEAAKLLAEYRARRESAVREAEEIISNARAEAERTADRGQDTDGRVRGAAHQDGRDQDRAGRGAGASLTFAPPLRTLRWPQLRQILGDTLKGSAADALINQGIGEVRQKLN